jgi:hypothetical protein
MSYLVERIKLTWQHLIVDKLEKELQKLSAEKDALKLKAEQARAKYEAAVKAVKDAL